MSTPIDVKQAARLRVLDAYYEISDGNPMGLIEPEEIEKHTRLSPQEVMAAIQYLDNEGLLKIRAIGGLASISHAGVVEVERARSRPSESTDHFTPIVINQVFHGAVGAVQTGAGSVANVQQAVGFDADGVRSLIEVMRKSVPPDRPQLQEAVEDLAEEAAKPQPKPSKIRAYLAAAATYGKDIAVLAGAAKEIAKLCGVDIP